MAIFGKPPVKKVQPPKPTDRGVKRESHVVSARELASQVANRKAEKLRGLEPLGETSLRGASIIDWSSAPKAIEVAQANQTPAERKLELFRTEWNGSVDPVFREFAY